MAATKVLVKCPTTGRELSTGVEMDAATFERLPELTSELKCPICGVDHIWSTREARLDEVTPSLPELPWLFINNKFAEND